VSIITILLSKEQLDIQAPGYQAPLPEDQVVPPTEEELGKEGGEQRSGGRRWA
jgi:hypothetical protein